MGGAMYDISHDLIDGVCSNGTASARASAAMAQRIIFLEVACAD